MIRKVRIENFKSIPDLSLDLGRVTVLIGANGSGKSNILEAIALASAAAQDKLDNEFLVSRGIRVTETRFMRSAFSESGRSEGIGISIHEDELADFSCQLTVNEKSSYPKWSVTWMGPVFDLIADKVAKQLDRGLVGAALSVRRWWLSLNGADPLLIAAFLENNSVLPGFLIYAPENSALRTFQAEGQILPLGIKGEGLFSHLKALNTNANKDRLLKIKERLTLIDWFESFDIPENLSPGERSIRIRDCYLPDEALLDQRSANEGFLYLLFYITLFISPDTPTFFSIDNIDSALNPKLCIALLQQLVALAKEHGKQVILTTHNPAVLDGLNLHDEEQRLLVVDRNKEGHTRVHRVDPPKPGAGQTPVSLSEAFMRGYIGGLPKNF
jgi:predicted ATPase